MLICFVKYPGKATLVESSVPKESGEDDEDEDDNNNDKNFKNNCRSSKNNDDDYDVVSKEPLPSSPDDMNSYEASWQECRMKWCLRSRSKDRQGNNIAPATGWTENEDHQDHNNCNSVRGGRGRAMMTAGIRRNPPEKRQACSSDSTGTSSQEEQDAASSSRRPKVKPLSRVQSVRNDTGAHRYRTRQRVAAEMLDEQRTIAEATTRDLCRSSAAKIKKSLSFRNPAPKKVATGGDRLLRPVGDDNDYHQHNNNNNDNINRHHHYYNNDPPHDNNNHCYQHHGELFDDVQQPHQYHQQPQLLPEVAVVTASSSITPSSATTATAIDNGGQDNFAIPRPKLIVPVHTYGLRKRRTGNTISSNRTASDVNGTSASNTIASSSSSLSTTNDSKKHHNSCPGNVI